MPSTLTSLTLIAKLQQADNEQAWIRLCQRYRPILLAVARRAGVRQNDLDDLAQEALVVAFDKLRRGEYDRARGRLKSWLLGIAINKTREFRRKRRQQNWQVVEPGSTTGFWDRIPDGREIADAFEQEWQSTLLGEALQEVRRQVDTTTFEAFKLYALQGLAPTEVAERLGISREAVYNSKSRVLSRLRQIRAELEKTW